MADEIVVPEFMNLPAANSVLEITLTKTIIRCGCDDPLSHARLQQPCPTPRKVEHVDVPRRWWPGR